MPTTACPSRSAVEIGALGLLDTRDNVGLLVQLVARHGTRAGVHEQAIRNRRAVAGALLYEDLGTGRDELFECVGDERHAPLVGRTLFHHTYLHWDPWATERTESCSKNIGCGRIVLIRDFKRNTGRSAAHRGCPVCASWTTPRSSRSTASTRPHS